MTPRRARGLRIVQIFHIDDSSPFAENYGYVMAIAPLAVAPDAVFRKCRHSALIGSGLDVWLVSNGIRLISICSGGLLAVRAGLL